MTNFFQFWDFRSWKWQQRVPKFWFFSIFSQFSSSGSSVSCLNDRLDHSLHISFTSHDDFLIWLPSIFEKKNVFFEIFKLGRLQTCTKLSVQAINDPATQHSSHLALKQLGTRATQHLSNFALKQYSNQAVNQAGPLPACLFFFWLPSICQKSVFQYF